MYVFMPLFVVVLYLGVGKFLGVLVRPMASFI